MKRYEITLKSHCEAPDFEDTVEAQSLEEAAEQFEATHALLEFMASDLIEHIEEVE